MSDCAPLLVDPDDAVQRVAMDVMALAPEKRPEALEMAMRVCMALAMAQGANEVDATVFALGMQRSIEGAMLAIKASGGDATALNAPRATNNRSSLHSDGTPSPVPSRSASDAVIDPATILAP